MAIEAKPPVQWNKGEAALHILRREFGDDWPDKVKVIFAGDDTTDEDAMRVSSMKYIYWFIYEIQVNFIFVGIERCEQKFPSLIKFWNWNACRFSCTINQNGYIDIAMASKGNVLDLN